MCSHLKVEKGCVEFRRPVVVVVRQGEVGCGELGRVIPLCSLKWSTILRRDMRDEIWIDQMHDSINLRKISSTSFGIPIILGGSLTAHLHDDEKMMFSHPAKPFGHYII